MRMCYTNHFYALTNTIILARFCPVVVGPTADWRLLQWISKMGPNFCVFKSVFSLIVFICIFYYHYSHTYILPDWFLPFCFVTASLNSVSTWSFQTVTKQQVLYSLHEEKQLLMPSMILFNIFGMKTSVPPCCKCIYGN